MAAAQNKRLMNALVMRDAPNGGSGAELPASSLGGGSPPRVSTAELLQAVVDGCRCIEGGGGADGGELRDEEIEALLDRAEGDSDEEPCTTQELADASNASDPRHAGAMHQPMFFGSPLELISAVSKLTHPDLREFRSCAYEWIRRQGEQATCAGDGFRGRPQRHPGGAGGHLPEPSSHPRV